MSNKSIQSVSPNFVIPAGTQVVLLESIRINGSNDQFKKPGNVGVVIKCPPHNDLPYLIRFNDGAEVTATRKQLVLRRQEIDVAFGCAAGSWYIGIIPTERHLPLPSRLEGIRPVQ